MLDSKSSISEVTPDLRVSDQRTEDQVTRGAQRLVLGEVVRYGKEQMTRQN